MCVCLSVEGETDFPFSEGNSGSLGVAALAPGAGARVSAQEQHLQ